MRPSRREASEGAQPLKSSYRTPVVSGDRPGLFTRAFDNTYEFDSLSGQSFSTVPAANWTKGTLYRYQVPFSGPSAIGYYMSDPSDPNQWVISGPG